MRSAAVCLLTCCLILLGAPALNWLPASAQEITEVCPPGGIQPWTADFQPDGIILTTFDRNNIWLYDVARNARYPLPETTPCSTNCHLSPDALWITYFDAASRAISKMRLDGTERTLLDDNAAEIEWWTTDTLLIWTPAHEAYLRSEDGAEREFLHVERTVNIQPGGYWGLQIEQQEENFLRVLVNTQTLSLAQATGQRVILGMDIRYFNAAAWSPTGEWLAFAAPGLYDANVGLAGAELFGIRPGDSAPTQWTNLNSAYGAARINGHAPGELSWSPDGAHIAFWVIELLGPNPEGDTGHAVIHVLDINTGTVTAYCGFATDEHTPNPPRLLWSPDSTHLAFGGNVPGDDMGYLLLALEISTGVFTALSDGIYPALGTPDVIAWGATPP